MSSLGASHQLFPLGAFGGVEVEYGGCRGFSSACGVRVEWVELDATHVGEPHQRFPIRGEEETRCFLLTNRRGQVQVSIQGGWCPGAFFS